MRASWEKKIATKKFDTIATVTKKLIKSLTK